MSRVPEDLIDKSKEFSGVRVGKGLHGVVTFDCIKLPAVTRTKKDMSS